jgi:HD-GYP domain-containing protein (c-di-GMP phosphodiesterase class II)
MCRTIQSPDRGKHRSLWQNQATAGQQARRIPENPFAFFVMAIEIEKIKVDVQDLKPGMYVADLDRPWLETPFLLQGFEIRSDAEIAMLKKHCRYVYVDIRRTTKFTPQYFQSAIMARSRLLEAEDARIRQKLRELTQTSAAPSSPTARKPYLDQTTLEQEIVQAKVVEREARSLMREAMEDVQKGRRVNLEMAKKVIANMTDSVVRNPDALVCLSQLKDVSEYTALHSIRTSIVALAFGRHLALSRDELTTLGLGVLLHDVGMARVPKEILAKHAPLTPGEFDIMTQHVDWGLEIVRESGGLPQGALDVIAQHHERSDGQGYPHHRAGQAITPAGMIGAIVDVYDAVTSDRSYGTALSAEDALKSMYEWRNKDFQAQLIEEFIRCMGIFPIGSLVELSTGTIGVVITINRARRLKPKVALVLTATKAPYSSKVITDLMEHKDAQGKEIKIARVLPSGSYDINPMDHIIQL